MTMSSRFSFGRSAITLMAVSILAVLTPFETLAQNRPSGSTSTPLSIDWAVAAALGIDPLISIASAAEERATAHVSLTQSAFLPSIRIEGVATQFREAMPIAPFHGFSVSSAPEFDETLFQSRVVASHTWFDSGLRKGERRAAEARSNGATSRTTLARMNVIEDAAAAYLSVVAGRAILEAGERQVAALVAEQERAQLLLNVGRAARVELLRAEAALSDAQAHRESARANLSIHEREFARLTGLTSVEVSGRPLEPVEQFSDVAPPARSVLAPNPNHPLLSESRSQLLAAEATRSVATARYRPRLSSEAGLNQYGAGSGDFSAEWQVGLLVSYPLFTGGGRGAELEGAEAAVREASAQVDLRTRDLDAALDVAWASWVDANARLVAFETSVARYEEVARIEALSLTVGSGVQTDFLSAEAALFNARAARADARKAAGLAQLRLAHARGILTEEWIQNPTAQSPTTQSPTAQERSAQSPTAGDPGTRAPEVRIPEMQTPQTQTQEPQVYEKQNVLEMIP